MEISEAQLKIIEDAIKTKSESASQKAIEEIQRIRKPPITSYLPKDIMMRVR